MHVAIGYALFCVLNIVVGSLRERACRLNDVMCACRDSHYWHVCSSEGATIASTESKYAGGIMSCENDDIQSFVRDMSALIGFDNESIEKTVLSVFVAKRSKLATNLSLENATKLLAVLMERSEYRLLRPTHFGPSGGPSVGAQQGYARSLMAMRNAGILDQYELASIAADRSQEVGVRTLAQNTLIMTAALQYWQQGSAQKTETPLDINTATLEQLTSELAISPEAANELQKERSARPFRNLADCVQRCNIPQAVANKWNATASRILPPQWQSDAPLEIQEYIGDWLASTNSDTLRAMGNGAEQASAYMQHTLDRTRQDVWADMSQSELLGLLVGATKRRKWLGSDAQALYTAAGCPDQTPVAGSAEAIAMGKLWRTMQPIPVGATDSDIVGLQHAQQWFAAQHRPNAPTEGHGANVRAHMQQLAQRGKAQLARLKTEGDTLTQKARQTILASATEPRGNSYWMGEADRFSEQWAIHAAQVLHAERNMRLQVAPALQVKNPVQPLQFIGSTRVLPNDIKSLSRASSMIDRQLFPKNSTPIIKYHPTGRPSYSPESNEILCSATYATMSQLPHELLHWVENSNHVMREAGDVYLRQRSAGSKLSTVQKLTGGVYPFPERAVQAGFSDAYTGRLYNSLNETEIHTVGIERLLNDPVAFAEEDPHHFDHVLKILHNVDGVYTHPEWQTESPS